MIRLTVEGVKYEFDNERLLLAEARELKTLAHMSPPKWNAALDEGDPDAIAFLIYLAKKRSGETLRFSDLDGLDYADIDMEVVDDEAEQAEGEQKAADPTPQPEPSKPPPSGGLTPSDGTGSTLPPSPTASSTIPTASTL